MTEKDRNSLEHTKWRCQYHVVFAPKYRRQVIYREILLLSAVYFSPFLSMKLALDILEC